MLSITFSNKVNFRDEMRKLILAFTVLLLLSLQYNIYGQRFRDKKSKNFTVSAFILRKFDKIMTKEKPLLRQEKGKQKKLGNILKLRISL